MQNFTLISQKKQFIIILKIFRLPEKTTQDNFYFGAPVKGNEYTGKQVLFPQSNPKISEEVHKQYVKTHGNYEAGEQKQRDYVWNLDPNDHRFGKKVPPVPNEINQIMNQD